MKNNDFLKIEQRSDVAIIWMDRKGEKHNTLGRTLVDDFSEILNQIENDDSVKAMVFASRKEDSFIAGADLDLIQDADRSFIEEFNREGNKLLDRIANFKKPIIAAVHGTSLGGGVEVMLACHYRIATSHPKTVFGLPEVKLGLLPGAGGTQRLPKLVGLQKALDIMLTGKNVYAYPAKKMGFVDELVHKHALIEVAVQRASEFGASGVRRKKKKKSLLDKILENNPLGRSIVYSQAKKTVLKQTKGNYPAPLRIIESVKVGLEKGYAKGREAETMGFVDLAETLESKALLNLFFAMTDSKKNPDKNQAKDINRIGVLGAGLMGSGIADVSVNKGYRVIMKDRSLEAAAKGVSEIKKGLDKKVKRKIIPSFQRDEVLAKVQPCVTYDYFHGVDLVIEAVFEDLDLKKSIIADLEKVLPEHAIIASNTSSLPIKDIASASKRPEQILGMHYFSPVQKMPLLEIIKTDETADWVTSTAYEVGLRQGKTVIVVNDGPGFYTTRILAPLMNEALVLMEEGGEILHIDNAMKKFGYPVGPMVLLDEVGIDVGAHVAETMSPMFRKRGLEPTTVSHKLVEAGYLGRKNNKGVFKYDGKKKEVNNEIYSFFGSSARKKHDIEEIQFRVSSMMINEAIYCLQEEILLSPRDGDLGAILGLGFPPFLGGPFRYADYLGTQKLAHRLNGLADKFGERFRPAPLLEDLAKQNKGFYS